LPVFYFLSPLSRSLAPPSLCLSISISLPSSLFHPLSLAAAAADANASVQILLFKYLEDKDVFQTFCTTKLSKPLIHGVSASDEAEASMISKLKEACGFEYTNALQRMFTGG
jgi:hypothetical protein